MKTGPTSCSEKSVMNCHYSLRDNPEEHSPNFLKFKFEMDFEKNVIFGIGFAYSVYLLDCGLDDRGIVVEFLADARDSSFPHNVQTGFGTTQPLCVARKPQP